MLIGEPRKSLVREIKNLKELAYSDEDCDVENLEWISNIKEYPYHVIQEVNPENPEEYKVLKFNGAKIKKDFFDDGIVLDFTTDSINFLVKLAQEEDSGGRAVSNVLEQLLTDAKYMCFKNNYNKIIIDKETIEGKGIKYLKEESKKIEKKVDKC